MSDSEKMNALDLIINVLKEHEKTLDSLIEKLGNFLNTVGEEREETKHFPLEKASPETRVEPRTRTPMIITCQGWSMFKTLCSGAEIVSFQINKELEIKALKDSIIYTYIEAVPRNVEKMECGVEIKHQLDSFGVIRTLSDQLNVPEKQIIIGEITFPH